MTIAAQLGRISSNLESSTRAREFCALARCLALSKGSQGMARQLASEARLSKTIVDILAGDPECPASRVSLSSSNARRSWLAARATPVGLCRSQITTCSLAHF